MKEIRIHSHARERMSLRGVSEDEVFKTINEGESFAGKFGRIGFRRNFIFLGIWKGKRYSAKQVELFAVKDENGWLVISVLAKYF
jgi:hypothetical protein